VDIFGKSLRTFSEGLWDKATRTYCIISIYLLVYTY